jgi:5-methylcytosine-specific restriction endonuclease McrA
MTARERPEWTGAKPESMPGIRVLLRLYDNQDGKCACGCETPMSFERDQIDCDHKIPLKDGGENRESNLQLLLRRHHITKTNAENVARGIANQHKAKAFSRPKRGRFLTNRDGKYKKRMDGVLVDRRTGEPV